MSLDMTVKLLREIAQITVYLPIFFYTVDYFTRISNFKIAFIMSV